MVYKTSFLYPQWRLMTKNTQNLEFVFITSQSHEMHHAITITKQQTDLCFKAAHRQIYHYLMEIGKSVRFWYRLSYCHSVSIPIMTDMKYRYEDASTKPVPDSLVPTNVDISNNHLVPTEPQLYWLVIDSRGVTPDHMLRWRHWGFCVPFRLSGVSSPNGTRTSAS